MPLLRFHWDFFGADAKQTAEHFLEKIVAFCDREGIRDYKHWVRVQQIRSIAILECDEKHLVIVRDKLRPKRGERVIEE